MNLHHKYPHLQFPNIGTDNQALTKLSSPIKDQELSIKREAVTLKQTAVEA
jgi:hypothetical protein